jgi:hypothetical protein
VVQRASTVGGRQRVESAKACLRAVLWLDLGKHDYRDEDTQQIVCRSSERIQADISGQSPQRDVALLAVAYGVGLQSNEVARLLVSDYLHADGSVKPRDGPTP